MEYKHLNSSVQRVVSPEASWHWGT